MNKIITVGREFGSGGRELGRRLAEELDFAYYDQEIIREIANRTSMSEKYVQQIVEHKLPVSYPIHIGKSFYIAANPVMDQTQAIYQEQSRILMEMAERSDCVIVGRCADYILRGLKPFRIFVYADIESKLARCRMNEQGTEKLSDKELKKKIASVDKHRASYYDFYTGQKWGVPLNYDLCINTTQVIIQEIAPVLAKMFQ